jgi:peptidoglycan/LPS O-acetylase OafA/YrhL
MTAGHPAADPGLAARSPKAAPASTRAETFRPDVEGLRGIAILLVVLFHAGLGPFPGGFVGVDVFFVISGFLITGLLLRERERTGRIGLASFYARRVRRLLPAALVAVAVLLPAASAVLAPLDRPAVALDGASATLSLANFRFALAEGDYFATMTNPSPFLHFWSLSVEEQFYLVWPVLLLLGARSRRPRVGAAITLGVVLVASLAASLVATDAAPSWAFYMLPTRAWQLATGGLLAIGAVALARIPGLPMAALGWVGLAAVLAAPVVVDPAWAYPGVAALLPTLGAAALIASGQRRWSPAGLLAVGPLRFLGRISYSLYLWHWPILVLPAVAAGVPLEPGVRVGLVAASIAVATLSWAFVEEPFRRGGWSLALRPARTLGLAGAALAFVVAFAGGLSYRQASDLGLVGVSPAADAAAGKAAMDAVDDIDWTADWPAAVVTDDVPEDPGPGGGAVAPSAGPTARPDESAGPTAAPTARPTPAPRVSFVLPRDVRPSLSRAREDSERLRWDGCLAFEPATAPRDCVYGNRSGTFTVALVGDSHASAIFPAVEAVAKRQGWRLETYVKVSCPFIDMDVRNLSLKREYRECPPWRSAVLQLLAADPPDLILVSNSRWIFPVRTEDGTVARQAAAFARMLDRLPGTVVVVADTPAADRDIPACLSAHPDDIRPCAVPRSTAFSGAMVTRERTAAREAGAGLVDLSRVVCPSDPCPAVVGGMIVLRDNHHLTATFARSLAPALDRALTEILAPPTPTAPDVDAPAVLLTPRRARA